MNQHDCTWVQLHFHKSESAKNHLRFVSTLLVTAKALPPTTKHTCDIIIDKYIFVNYFSIKKEESSSFCYFLFFLSFSIHGGTFVVLTSTLEEVRSLFPSPLFAKIETSGRACSSFSFCMFA